MTDNKNENSESEARAVDEAEATADAAMVSNLLQKAPTIEALLQQIDGPSLTSYKAEESSYVGHNLPITAGGDLEVPIQIAIAGSMVHYEVELKSHDVVFEIIAEREEGVTVVKEASRVNVAESPISQKFLVGSVPCLLTFRWDNGYSWMREKVISYRITVTPPNRDSVIKGRRRRAIPCLKAVQEDLTELKAQTQMVKAEKETKRNLVEKLKKQLHDAQQELENAEKEEAILVEREKLRKEQESALLQRVQKGWPDEK
ncbi:hypothetical protein FisN_2Hh221 [Fistulifera solaris]|uniref:GOLD domain-containing protein n=1 Tax=Fistulifera solaris TaxID=1519565 RepID=A0A1Z5JEG3_FISSO|nr:hypothetical protein FisN_2Hh221 [Fistulifera solaris]|eukprot:GAX12390.1 hypothetical protein FisN_2Hh221 [Fistulifera solaris]